MAAEKKSVFYVKYLADEAIFKQIVGDDGSIALTRLENDSPASVAGPVLAGHPLLPIFAGALVIAGVFKLVSLGAAGPRW